MVRYGCVHAGLFVKAMGDDSPPLSPYCLLVWCFDRERCARNRALWRFNVGRPGQFCCNCTIFLFHRRFGGPGALLTGSRCCTVGPNRIQPRGRENRGMVTRKQRNVCRASFPSVFI